MDKLEQIVDVGRELRVKNLQRMDMEDQLNQIKKLISDIRHHQLPELMVAAGVNKVGLPAQGNMPPVDMVLKPYYKANIAVDWPEEKKKAGFNLLQEKGFGDLIKTRFTIEVPRNESEIATSIRELLQEHEVKFTESPAIAWSTLTALVREQAESGHPFSPLELETLGAMAGLIAEIKEKD